MTLDTDGFLSPNINKSEQSFLNTKLILLGICEKVWGSEFTPNSSSNVHASCLITTLHHKTLSCFHTILFNPSFYIWEQDLTSLPSHLISFIFKLSGPALRSPETTQADLLVLSSLDTFPTVKPCSYSPLLQHILIMHRNTKNSLTLFLLSIIKIPLFFKLYILWGLEHSVLQIQTVVEG